MSAVLRAGGAGGLWCLSLQLTKAGQLSGFLTTFGKSNFSITYKFERKTHLRERKFKITPFYLAQRGFRTSPADSCQGWRRQSQWAGAWVPSSITGVWLILSFHG